MDKVVVKPTWQLTWGLWWRMFLINLGIIGVILGITFAVVGTAIWAWLQSVPTIPY